MGSYFINKIIQKFIERTIRMVVVSEIQRENTLIKIFSTTVSIAIITITLLMILQEFGLEIGPILAAAGIVGLAFGFGGQYLIRGYNFGTFHNS